MTSVAVLLDAELYSAIKNASYKVLDYAYHSCKIKT